MLETNAAADGHGIFKRLDQLNEFERGPVTDDKLCGGGYFAGNFAGEHVAATEFVIGALFVTFGASARDVFVGLLLGNALAVLSWVLVCAPIAVQTRLTLYWYLRKIGGPGMMVIYNVANAVMYCILAGSMITVAASAVRIPFGIPVQTGWFPTDYRFVLVVWGVGAVVVTLAIWGFKRLALFAAICSPWMLLMFVAGALVMLPRLGAVHGFADFWKIAAEKIWTGHTATGEAPLGFWHIVSFAWICNLGMHLGMSDMALLRYAKRASYGFYSAFGMYLGHYLAWICAGIMGAAAAVVLKIPLGSLDSGAVAVESLGVIGALAVIVAGWTTANPTLYRAGLALQVVTPGWPRWLVTLIAGAVTTTVACSPFVFVKLLDFVGLYGLLLMPVGTIVVVEHWIFPRIGMMQFWASRKGLTWNWPALIAWFAVLGFGVYGWRSGTIHLFFLALPMWVLTAVLYIALAALAGARDRLLEETADQPPADKPPNPNKLLSADKPVAPAAIRAGSSGLAYVAAATALVALVLCLVLPVMVFAGSLSSDSLKSWLIWATIAYFVGGAVWVSQRRGALEG